MAWPRCYALHIKYHLLFFTHETFTWVGHRGNRDLVVGFTGAEAGDDILNPPQLFSDLDFFLLHTEKQRDTHYELLVYRGNRLQIQHHLFCQDTVLILS